MGPRQGQKEKDKEKNQAIIGALQVFNRMLDLEKPTKYGFREVKTRHDILLDYMNKLPPEPPFVPPPEVDPDLTQITKQEWWRTVAVTFIMGFFIGIAALWQLQEVATTPSSFVMEGIAHGFNRSLSGM